MPENDEKVEVAFPAEEGEEKAEEIARVFLALESVEHAEDEVMVQARVETITAKMIHSFGENARWKGQVVEGFLNIKPVEAHVNIVLPPSAALRDLVSAVVNECVVATEVVTLAAEARDNARRAVQSLEDWATQHQQASEQALDREMDQTLW